MNIGCKRGGEQVNKIICIVGESGSGKSTIAELLNKECGLKNIDSFTTRKPRHENETGHIFTTEKQYQCNKANQIIVAETLFDGNRYWTTKGQFNADCVYVVDVVGVKELREKVKDAEIVVIYLRCNDLERINRMYQRKGYNPFEHVISKDVQREVRQRLVHDKEAFKIVPCNYSIDANRDIEEVLKDVKSIIDSV